MISKTHGSVMTAEQLFALPDDGKCYELVKGVMHVMSPAGSEHGQLALAIGASLYAHVKAHRLGTAYAAETGFRISRDPDTVRAPDVAFVSNKSSAKAGATRGYLDLAPDLVVEVISPNDTYSDVEGKVGEWIEAGSRIVLVVDPANETFRVYGEEGRTQTLRRGETFSAGNACQGWTLNVDEVFDRM
jgi:Uma2 family endonuclease